MHLKERHFRTLFFAIGCALERGSHDWVAIDGYETIEEAIDDLALQTFKEFGHLSSLVKVVREAMDGVLEKEDSDEQ
jgi:hypothetical protein